jgi:hypothetical protein
MESHKELLIENHRSNVNYLLLCGKIAGQFPGMAGVRGQKDKADAWVVALAKFLDGNPYSRVVVCNETLDRRPNRKIPSACKASGLRCMNLLEMLDQEYPDDGWLD